MKLLLLEGPDRTGKNSLIQGLVSQADNFVVRHFGAAKGSNDHEKRVSQHDFFKKEFKLASDRNKFDMGDLKRYPRDIWICNRAHLGEFVYGKIYRETNPENWVFQLEELYGLHLDASIYLLLLTADPEFLCKRDDGKSFSNELEKRTEEIAAFYSAYDKSKILNKRMLNVSANGEYLPKETILSEVNKFLFS